MSLPDRIRNQPRLWASAGLITVGLAAGAVIGTTMTAGAATTTTQVSSASASTSTSPSSTPSSSSGSSSSSTATPTAGDGDGDGGHGHGGGGGGGGLSSSGTVTAVGTESVTIDGKAYAVTTSSDMDKNGEATLSALAVGDKVTFSTESAASTPTIDKLHAGNEALDKPADADATSGGSTSTAG